MFLIEWYGDAKSDENLKYPCKTLEDSIEVLLALRTYHDFLRDSNLVKTDYLYFFKKLNPVLEEYEDWEDFETGISDPLEFWEYLNN